MQPAHHIRNAGGPPPHRRPGSGAEPRAEYARRLDLRRAAVARLERRDAWIANLRLAVFLLGAAVVWATATRPWLHGGWVALPVLGFIALMAIHDRTLRALRRARGAVEYYRRGLARLDDAWAGAGVTDASLAPADHPYAADLDLFGTGSLFDLLCTARTRNGQRMLADWMCGPAPRDVILTRQEAVEELRTKLDLREDLALLGGEVRATVRPSGLAAWGEAPAVLHRTGLRVAAGVLGVLSLICAAGWLVTWRADSVFAIPFFAAFLPGLALRRWFRTPIQRVLDTIDEPCRELEVLGGVLARMERESFRRAHLRQLHASLVTGDVPASARIATLERLAQWLEARLNQFFLPFAILLLWDLQFACATEAWRARYGPCIRGWLEAVGELEALCALAGYAYEHPGEPFPEIVEGGPLFDGTDVGHPLLPVATTVRNDVRLDGTLQVLLVSGSNMSGKSTLLRTVGVNAVLAMTGAPVRAKRLALSPLSVGASLRTLDSLQAGTSRFYAEIHRLRRIMDLTGGERPVLFLLDELLHGTNSHDRSIGAEGVIRGLLDRGAIGLVSTHDLALAKTADALAPRAANVHFADHLENGRIQFDYRLRPGVVQKSNALELMRAVGLDV